MDERQRLEIENSELISAQSGLEREIEVKAHENETLKGRLAVLDRTARQPVSSAVTLSDRIGSNTKYSIASTGSAKGPQSPFVTVLRDQAERRGPRIVQIQRLLQRHGFPVNADGWYGRETESAVRRFQRSQGLESDGIVGPATSVALHRLPRTLYQIRRVGLQQHAVTRQNVSAIQRTLRRAGYRVAVDGRLGLETEVALTRFQRAHGLYPDGLVGPKTRRALEQAAR